MLLDDEINNLFGRIHFWMPSQGDQTEFVAGSAAGSFPAVLAYDASRQRFLLRTPIAEEEKFGCKMTTYIRNAVSEAQINEIIENADRAIWKYSSNDDETQIALWRWNMRSALDTIRAKGVGTFIPGFRPGMQGMSGLLVSGQVLVHLHHIAQRI